MKQKNLSLRSKQRTRVFDAYRGRGHQNSNLWLVYSVKMDRDFILPSDRQLVHWLFYLETNSFVQSFDLVPDAVLSHDQSEVRASEYDAVVTNLDQSKEHHEVKSAPDEKAPARSQLLAQSSASGKEGVKYRIFTDYELKPHVRTAIHWTKPLAFAAQLRNGTFPRAAVRVQSFLQENQKGNLRQIVQGLNDFDEACVIGLMVRLALKGQLHFSLEENAFSYSTLWQWTGGE